MYSYKPVLEFFCKNTNPLKILEWGSGKSTKMMAKWCPTASILSLEHDPKWAERAASYLKPYKNVMLKTLKYGGLESQGYITYPMLLFLQNHLYYDLIFIDGRSRCDCLIIASMLTDKGTVILHDSERKHYIPGMSVYEHVINFPTMRTAVMSHKSLEGVPAIQTPLERLKKRLGIGILKSKP